MILDTNAVSALFSGDPLIRPILELAERHQLPSIVIGEYRYGLARSAQRDVLGALLDQLTQQSDVLSVGEATAVAYADVRDQLRRDGKPIPENDVWICALAIEHRLPVVTRDRHFSYATGVSVLDW